MQEKTPRPEGFRRKPATRYVERNPRCVPGLLIVLRLEGIPGNSPELLGVLAAAMPFVKLNVSGQAQRILLIAPLAVGAFIIFYLLTRDIRHVSFGLPLVLAGYAVEFVGLLKDIRSGA